MRLVCLWYLCEGSFCRLGLILSAFESLNWVSLGWCRLFEASFTLKKHHNPPYVETFDRRPYPVSKISSSAANQRVYSTAYAFRL